MDKTEQNINSIQNIKCRICWENQGQTMLTPCQCSGSAKYVHEKCLKRWFERGVQQNMLKIKKLSNGDSYISCQICKGQIVFSGIKKSGCLPKYEVHQRICENVGQFVCKVITNIIYLIIFSILIYRLVESIQYGQDMIASHVILSLLILVALVCYIKLFIPMLGEYCWGQGVLEIKFLSRNHSHTHESYQQVQQEKYRNKQKNSMVMQEIQQIQER